MGESIFNIVFNSRNMAKMAPVFIPATPIIMSDTDANTDKVSVYNEKNRHMPRHACMWLAKMWNYTI